MRRPHLLTPAGRYVLRRLVQGARLARKDGGWEMTERAWVERVNPLTVLRLLDAGYVEREGATYLITDAGRKALEEPER